MNPAPMMMLTVVALAATVYAQIEIPRFTANRHAIVATRAGLALIGLLWGCTLADNMAMSGGPPLLAFMLGFGGVHLPAALILFFKRLASEGKS